MPPTTLLVGVIHLDIEWLGDANVELENLPRNVPVQAIRMDRASAISLVENAPVVDYFRVILVIFCFWIDKCPFSPGFSPKR